jgi:VWFA-related protein
MALAFATALVSAQQSPPASQQPIGQKPPVFRGGANLVQVDTYPTKDGRVAEGLKASDFEIYEDGKLQAVDSMEFIRIEPVTPDALRQDPNTQEEGNLAASDPHNRVFVVYLDYKSVNLQGSHAVVRPVVDFLNRLLAPNDLFGVMTQKLRPRDLILGRQTQTLEEQLSRHWTWGQQGQLMTDPEEDALVNNCYPVVIPLDRLRMDQVLSSLDGLMTYLGNLREARKVVVLLTRGWRLPGRDQTLANAALGRGPGIPTPGVDPRGRITNNPDPARGSGGDRSGCAAQAARLYDMDFQERMRDLVNSANRNNVTFYPLNPAGLEAPDVMNAPSANAAMNDLHDRNESVLTLAGATDGMAIMTNDLNAGFRRITDDVSAYYVLSYYSNNLKFDGRFRRIEVKMKAPGLKVRARRGYFAPAENGATTRAGVATPAAAKEPSAVDAALATLSKLRPAAEVFAYGTASAKELAVAVEISTLQMSSGRWTQGAEVQVSATDAAGTAVGTVTGKIEPNTRGVLVRVPLTAATGNGPWRVSARVTGGGQTLDDRIDVKPSTSKLLGDALVFRATPSGQSPLRAVADMQYRRTERVHLEWPILTPLDRREGRFLGKDGSVIPLPINLTEREVNGQQMLAADVLLAPLTEGDYVIEITAGAAAESEKKLVGIRVVR